jgi:L-ribulose-5-phosphate 3-epimerase
MISDIRRLNRRRLLGHVAVGGCSLAAGHGLLRPLHAADPTADTPAPLAGRLKKTLKIGMVKLPQAGFTERFAAARAAGFDGIEMQFPGDDVAETGRAMAATGLPVDGSVCGQHWQVRHTSGDAATRRAALDNLLQAIRDTHAVGGHSVLLVVGKGEDGPEDLLWKRSVDNISQAIPLAAELGVQILVENVWNQFLYDHEGDATQTAEKFVRYIDAFESPWVGMQFDIGNHWKYGPTGDWIRQLGHRIRKLDVKGFSRSSNRFTAIGAGDIDFADIRQSLLDINFHGWVAAEVAGGNEADLRVVAEQMDRVFGLA